MKQKQIAATKIRPTLIIGEDIKISTRNIKSNKKPLKRSEDCSCTFKEFVTYDTTDVYLYEDYCKTICCDIIDNEFLDNTLCSEKKDLPYIILKEKDSHINAKRILVFSTNAKLLKSEKIVHKSATHKATEYKIKTLTICGILQEEKRIFESDIIDKLREAKVTIVPSNGFYDIDEIVKI